MAQQRIDGNVVIITGGASGIGRATALAFARERCKVVIADKARENLAKVAREIRDIRGEVLAFPTDAGIASQVNKMVKATMDRWGKVDILINNAGDESFGKVTELTEDKWDAGERVNLRSYFLCTKAVLTIGRMLDRKEGFIINTGSTLVRSSRADWAAHCAFKNGALGFTDALRKDLAPFNIRVTLLNPGQVRTPLTTRRYVLGEIQKHVPGPKWLKPEDIADVTVYLASLPWYMNLAEVAIVHTGRIQADPNSW